MDMFGSLTVEGCRGAGSGCKARPTAGRSLTACYEKPPAPRVNFARKKARHGKRNGT